MKLDEGIIGDQIKLKKAKDRRSLTIPKLKTNWEIPFMEPKETKRVIGINHNPWLDRLNEFNPFFSEQITKNKPVTENLISTRTINWRVGLNQTYYNFFFFGRRLLTKQDILPGGPVELLSKINAI